MQSSKPWPCPDCGHNLGSIIDGQLLVSNHEVNTDGSNLVVKCPECSRRKIWFANDRLQDFFKFVAREIAQYID